MDVLVFTHGHLELTIRCINAIYQHTFNPFHLIVMDDSTPDMDKGTDLTPLWLEKFRATHENFTFVHSEEPFDSSYPIFKEALKHCQTPYLVLIVNSMVVEPEWDVAGLEMMKNNTDVGIVGFKQLDWWTRVIQSAGMFSTFGGGMLSDVGQGLASHRYSNVYECDAVAWAFVLLRKEAIEGKFDYCPYHGFKGWEEIDTCLLVRQQGWRILYCGLGVGYHQARATRGVQNGDAEEFKLANRLNLENREIFAKRWGYWPDYHKHSHVREFFPMMKSRELLVPPVSRNMGR